MTTPKTLYLIDGSAYVYRAYHAIRSLSNSKGLPTNAVYGFTRMLLKLMEERRPEFVALCFDAKGPTFRHDLYPDYKANRPPMPEDLALQIPYIKEVVTAFNLAMLEKPGFEADDLIGTLALQARKAGFAVIMVTGDKDFLQLVADTATVWDPMKEKTVDAASIRDEYGVEPLQMIDVMGLSGDTSDNVPGVPGIGPKTARGLIRKYENLENLYDRIDTLPQNKQQAKLVANREQAFLSRRLVTIDTQVPIAFDPERFKIGTPDNSALSRLFNTLEFRQLQQAFPAASDLSAKRYHCIRDTETLATVLEKVAHLGFLALDTETTSENPMAADLVGVSLALEPNEAYYIPCGHTYPQAPPQLPLALVVAKLKPVLENPTIHKVGQNIKYDWIVLARHGIDLAGVVFDTMLASYLLNPSKRAHNLDQIALDFLDHRTITYADVTGKGKLAATFAQVPLEKAVPYACEDADITLQAHGVLSGELTRLGLNELLQTVEMPLVPVLMRMERRGIRVDADSLRSLSKNFEHQLTRIEGEIYAAAGEEFNINSSQQLGRILFEKLGLPTQKKTKKRTAYSTDVDVLTTLAAHHELPALIVRHRTLAKLKSTYADALLGLVGARTGRIHTSFNQTVTATGRLSSSDPNLQNIPIRTDEGREIRGAFVPEEGWQLISADYSQIELRILAHCSEDPILIDAFHKEEDIHIRTATEVFQVFPSFITSELRRQAKVINFGIIYGMGAFSLAKELGISQKMAQTYIDQYFARYSGVKSYIDQTVAEAQRTQKTSTLLGRIRLLPDIRSPNKNVRQFAERIAVNTPIQGTAADLLKVAMIRVDQALRDRKLRAAMLLTVHDELVLETPPDEVETVTDLLRDAMEGVWELTVPLKVNIAMGKNWAEAH